MRKKRGFSLLETLLAVAIAAFVIAAATQITVSVGRSYNRSEAQLNLDQRTGLALQWLTRDLQEAKTFTILSPSWLRVYYPVLQQDGTYNRAITDQVNTVDYYRGNSDGTRNPNGSFLIRKPATSNAHICLRDVNEVGFSSDNPSSVEVTLRVRRNEREGTFACNMLHRAIFLRNY